ncbi:MAG: hypothetical protein KC619_03600 [Myxococcales bacterium]|nr:hypothetical protein [Myxococcales bacterium]
MRTLVAGLLVVMLAPATALAHGRPPFFGDVAFHPTDPGFIVVRATWGLAVTEDGGASWRWICAAATGADPTREDPPIVVTPDGSILVGTFAGLARSTSDHCAFDRPEALDDHFVIDIAQEASAPGTIWAISTSGAEPDELFRSDDQGRTFARVGAPVDDVLLERVLVAPSDPMRVYLSGAIPIMTIAYDGGAPDGGPTMTERRGYLLRSTDRGETFERIEVPLVEEERNVHLLAIDPTDPDRLLVRMTRRTVDVRPERVLLTEDAGDSWTEVASGQQISGAVFSADGSRAWITARVIDGLFRSDDGGRSFSQIQRMSMPCIGRRGDELFTCVDQLTDGFALGRSTDGGDTLEPILHFEDIYEMVACDECTQVGHGCPEWFVDIAYDMRLDAGVGASVDGGISGAPRDAGPIPSECGGMDASVPPPMDAGVDAGPGEAPPGDCGCGVDGRPTSGLGLLIGLLALGLVRRRG